MDKLLVIMIFLSQITHTQILPKFFIRWVSWIGEDLFRVRLSIVSIVVLYGIESIIYNYIVSHQVFQLSKNQPIDVMDIIIFDTPTMMIITIFSVLSTIIFYIIFYSEKIILRDFFIAAFILITISIWPQNLKSADVYAYIGYSLTNWQFYNPPNIPFPIQYKAINDIWNTPIPSSTYGPVWQIINTTILKLLPTLYEKIEILRFFGVFLYILTAWLVWKITKNKKILSLILLSTPIYENFITNAHNDLLGVDFSLLGIYIYQNQKIKQRKFWSFLLVVFGGLVKIPYTGIGSIIYSLEKKLKNRIIFTIITILSVIIFSAIFGGLNYYHAFTNWSKSHHDNTQIAVITKEIFEVIGIYSIGFSILTGKVFFAATLLFPFFSFSITPWYCIWGLPYIINDYQKCSKFLITLPLISFIYDPTLGNYLINFTATVIIVFILIFSGYNRFKKINNFA